MRNHKAAVTDTGRRALCTEKVERQMVDVNANVSCKRCLKLLAPRQRIASDSIRWNPEWATYSDSIRWNPEWATYRQRR